MSEKNVLIIGTTYMDIHNDVIEGFQTLGYNVDFIQEKSSPKDPYNLRGYKGLKKLLFVNESCYYKQIKKYWESVLSDSTYSKKYNYLFVLDGQSLHPFLFEELRRRNADIRCVNYLFDTTNHVYRFDKNFKYFDKVFTFDISESKKYNIELLPIYWKEEPFYIEKYDIFAFGGYTDARFRLFQSIKEQADLLGLVSYIKIYTNPCIKQRGVKALIDDIYSYIFRVRPSVPQEVFDSDYNTHDRMSPSKFREMIGSSRVIVDTAVAEQDGLTARFMWALGERKKIITNNQSVLSYPFYSAKQILVVGNSDTLRLEDLRSFIDGDFSRDEMSPTINQYRIDNWIQTMLRN